MMIVVRNALGVWTKTRRSSVSGAFSNPKWQVNLDHRYLYFVWIYVSMGNGRMPPLQLSKAQGS